MLVLFQELAMSADELVSGRMAHYVWKHLDNGRFLPLKSFYAPLKSFLVAIF
jgi:hypothetical protein